MEEEAPAAAVEAALEAAPGPAQEEAPAAAVEAAPEAAPGPAQELAVQDEEMPAAAAEEPAAAADEEPAAAAEAEAAQPTPGLAHTFRGPSPAARAQAQMAATMNAKKLAQVLLAKEQQERLNSGLAPGSVRWGVLSGQGFPGGIDPSLYWNVQFQGKLRSFNKAKGFGFIDCNKTLEVFGRDVFVHQNQMQESGLGIGDDVLFEVNLNDQGQPQARKLQLAAAPSAASQAAAWNEYASGQQRSRPAAAAAVAGSSSSGAMPPGNFQPAQAQACTVGPAVAAKVLEEMLWKCPAPETMWEIVQQYEHILDKTHVAIGVYQCGLYHFYQHARSHERLVKALIDKLVRFPASELTPDESSRVLWAIALLEETRSNEQAIEFAIQLAGEAIQRYQEFSPAQMARFAASAQKLVRTPEEDEFLSTIISRFSDYALGDGKMPRFPPDELSVWTSFLTSISSHASQEASSRNVALAPPPFASLPFPAAGLPPMAGAFPPGNLGMPSGAAPLPGPPGQLGPPGLLVGPPGQLGLPNPFLAHGLPGPLGFPGFCPAGGGALTHPGPKALPGTFNRAAAATGPAHASGGAARHGGHGHASDGKPEKHDRPKASPLKPSPQQSKQGSSGGQAGGEQQLQKKLAATSAGKGAGKAGQPPAPADRRPRPPGPVPPGPISTAEGEPRGGTAAAVAEAVAKAPPAAVAESPKPRKGRSKIPSPLKEGQS